MRSSGTAVLPPVALLAVALVVVLGGTARAADVKLEVSSTPAKAEVPVGESIEVEVTVKNAGAEEAELTELAFDARSVSFELSVDGGRTAWDTQFHVDPPKSNMEPDPMRPLKRDKLKAGESWKKTFTIPAIAAGAWSIRAVYGGSVEAPRSLSVLADPARIAKVKEAEAKTVKVTPGPNGEAEVVCKLTTNLGTFTMRFFPKDALATGINFVRVAQKGLYEGKRFFRNAQDLQVLQGGADNGSAFFEWGIPLEQNLKHKALMVAMARGESTNSAGAQFYIVYGGLAAQLDRENGYAVFAQIVKGKDVVETMCSIKPRQGGQEPSAPITIESTKVQLAPKE
ncbi:MAG: peptidylprolyl isomerase [Planctomycetota bacterium]